MSIQKPLREQVLTLSAAYSKKVGKSEARLGTIIRNHGSFFRNMRRGGDCTTRNAESTVQWFSNNWPDDLPWPKDIVRPAPDPVSDDRKVDAA